MVDVSFETEVVTEMRSLSRGDHLAVEGEMAGVKYYHHGIFLGHDKGVADFGGTNKRTATVRIVDILEFTDQWRRQLVRNIYRSSECLPDEEAAKNAEALVANPRLWGAYDLLKNNCEHFATKCKIGRAVSFQVLQKLRDKIELVCTVIRASVSVSVSGSVNASISASKSASASAKKVLAGSSTSAGAGKYRADSK